MSLTKAFKQHHPTSRLYAYHHKPSVIDELKRQGVEIISDETIHRPGTMEQYMECTLENTLRKYRNVKFDLVFMNYPYVHFFGDVVSKQYAKFMPKCSPVDDVERIFKNGFLSDEVVFLIVTQLKYSMDMKKEREMTGSKVHAHIESVAKKYGYTLQPQWIWRGYGHKEARPVGFDRHSYQNRESREKNRQTSTICWFWSFFASIRHLYSTTDSIAEMHHHLALSIFPN